MTEPFTLLVTYQGTAGAHFDRAYYVEHHIPLVERSFAPYGLESAAAFFPAVDQDGTLAICECRFRDAEAFEAAFASPEAPAVMADVPRFTDLIPTRSRMAALSSE